MGFLYPGQSQSLRRVHYHILNHIPPDNRNRANRVSQLATQIAALQFDVRAEAENIKKKDERTLEELDKLLKAAGYKTREEYIEAALKRLTPEQRAEYQKMRDTLDKTDDALEIGWSVSGALLGIAAFSGLACQRFLCPYP